MKTYTAYLIIAITGILSGMLLGLGIGYSIFAPKELPDFYTEIVTTKLPTTGGIVYIDVCGKLRPSKVVRVDSINKLVWVKRANFYGIDIENYNQTEIKRLGELTW